MQNSRIFTNIGKSLLNLDFAFLVLSIVIALAAGLTKAENFTDSFAFAVLSGSIFFIAAYVIRISFLLTEFQTKYDASEQSHSTHFRDIKKLVDTIAKRNEVHNSYTQSVLRIFDHHDSHATNSVSRALDQFLDTVRIETEVIELKSDYMAKAVYNSFWQELLKRQKELSSSHPSIHVRTIHSSSINVWLFDHVINGTQEEFCKSGGVIDRVLVRNKDSRETLQQYLQVATGMKARGTNVYFIDTEKTDTKEHIFDDFLFCSFDSSFYVLAWDADTGGSGDFGRLIGCKLLLGQGQYADFRYRWVGLINKLNSQDADQAHNGLKDFMSLPSPAVAERLISD